MKDHLKKNWKRYALMAALAAGAYYGVPPETVISVLTNACSVLGC